MNCPVCGCFMAAGEDSTPYGSEYYWWCSWCQTAMGDPDALQSSAVSSPEDGESTTADTPPGFGEAPSGGPGATTSGRAS